MKTMTCKQLGGMCDEPVKGADENEMMMNGMTHLKAAHPDMAASIEAMPKDDPKMVEWSTKFHADFAAQPEDPA